MAKPSILLTPDSGYLGKLRAAYDQAFDEAVEKTKTVTARADLT